MQKYLGERTQVVLPYVLLFVLYVLLTSVTDGFFMGDTRIYARSITNSTSLGATFFDFGHAIWRPIGWLASRLDPRGPTYTLVTVNWFIGIIDVFLVYAISKRLSKDSWVPYFVAVLFLFCNPVLNYVQTGQPYMTGLMFILIGFYLIIRAADSDETSWRTPLLSGIALALGVCIWIPYIFALPAVGLYPLIFREYDNSRLRLVLRTGLICAAVGLLVYGGMALHLRIGSTEQFKQWVAASGHGIVQDAPLKAIQKMLLTLVRSVINMGEDGRLFKRYIVHDPFSPVSFSDLVRLSLWKLALFYVVVAAVVYNLFFSKTGRRMLVLLIVSVIPMLAFVVFAFEGGSIERYLPIFPIALVALTVSLSNEATRQWTRVLSVVFLVVVAVNNILATSKHSLSQQEQRVSARIVDLQPLLKTPNLVVTVNEQDDLYAFNQNFLFNPINQGGQEIDNLVAPNSTQIARWRQIFAAKALAIWEKGGDVWVTRRVLFKQPRPDWNWVEGDDPHITWANINQFFANIQFGKDVGGDDGFVQAVPSEQNKEFLTSVAANKVQLTSTRTDKTSEVAVLRRTVNLY